MDASAHFVVRKHGRHVFSLRDPYAHSGTKSYSTKLLPQRLYCSFKLTKSAYCATLFNKYHSFAFVVKLNKVRNTDEDLTLQFPHGIDNIFQLYRLEYLAGLKHETLGDLGNCILSPGCHVVVASA